MKATPVTLPCLLSLLLLFGPASSRAVDTTCMPGTFRLIAEQSDDINRAIEAAIAPMNFIKRPFARDRLRKICMPYPRLEIESLPDALLIVADPRAPIRMPLNGTPISWHREDGEPFNVSGVWKGPAFEQTFVSGTGRRVNRYTVSPDGQRLTIHVVITGGGLEGPVTYNLVYRRSS